MKTENFGPAAHALALAIVWSAAHASAVADNAAVVYVDGQIAASPCAKYDAAGRACGRGTATAYKTLKEAAAEAQPGTTVMIRAGTYREPLVPARSGTAERPITFKNFGSDAVVLTGIDAPAIQIIGLQHIVIEGLEIADTTGWARLQDARENLVRHMVFTRAIAVGTTGGFKIVRSLYNRISDNHFEDGNDNVMIQDASNGNVVEHNVFVTARHTLLCIKCSNSNVVRGNTFSNPRQKLMEIFDCEGGSDAPVIFNATKRNLVEKNVFAETHGAYREYQYNAIQHGGQYTMVRRNVFRDSAGGGVNYQYYARESLFVVSNRLFHNTFYGNHCFAVVGVTGDPKQYVDNRVVNNLFYKNTDCQGAGDQVSIADRSAVALVGNAMEKDDPGFVDEEKRDLRLSSRSRLIDGAGPLTVTRDAGEGTTMRVRDAFYFYDGFTIPGEVGDEIQLIGTSDAARVLHVDYATVALTLDRPLSWRAGQGVALKFSGAAPEVGAFEYEGPPR